MNRLAHASSPYLQQHADNPVDWYPWGAEALQMARDQNKPILLSIGYSACHWCHVMAHESFADPRVAEVMNQRYVNIKVDREERPDLDRIYQNAHMLLARRPGGWPLTVILTPDQVPFFAGTYFPDAPRHGLPAFVDVLHGVADFLAENPEEIATQNQSLQEAMTQMYNPPGGKLPGPRILDTGLNVLQQNFDADHGGFGGAPKFPHPATLEWLAWQGQRRALPAAEQMLEQTLTAMARGGIFDQIGGGFCRYSVDAQWMIPHFEKMLYDNGPLLGLYARQARRGDARSHWVVGRTVEWLVREMRAPSGAFYSSLDADSEGGEGSYYLWDVAAVEALLTEPEWAVVSLLWGLAEPANFAERWHLHEFHDPLQVAGTLGLEVADMLALVESARLKLLQARLMRPAPHRDEKILTAWNALLISGLARAGDQLDRSDWIDLAEQAMQAVQDLLWHDDRLYASYRAETGGTLPRAYLDDYALLLQATLDLLQIRWSPKRLEFAQTLARQLLTHFQDHRDGGFYFTASDHESLIQRPKVYADDAIASGNGVAAQALLQLGYLLVEPRYLEAAERTLHNAGPMMEEAPLGHMSLLQALDIFLDPPALVILRGHPVGTEVWRQELCVRQPAVWVFTLPAEGQGLPQSLAGKCQRGLEEGVVVAYLCRGTHCEPPVYQLSELLAILG